MAGYNVRKGVNVSQYLANLNTIPSAHDVAQQEENFNIDDELAQFTNAEFLDFDSADYLNQEASLEFDHNQDERARREHAAANHKSKGMDFVNGDFPFPAVNPFDISANQSSNLPAQNVVGDYTNHTPSHDIQVAYPQTSPVAFNPAPYPGQKHHLSSPPSSGSSISQIPESEPARLAAEEDKRRRNTAASARFRVKKKQREQALESTAKELENKTLALEQRIGQLETENEWLRGLVVEKNGGAKEDLRVKWAKVGGRRSTAEGKDGVGTMGQGAESA